MRLPYLAVSSVFPLLRLLLLSDVDKDIEIVALRHQLVVLKRQIDRPRVTPADRALLAALLHRLPRPKLRQLHLIVSPGTVLRWHRDLVGAENHVRAAHAACCCSTASWWRRAMISRSFARSPIGNSRMKLKAVDRARYGSRNSTVGHPRSRPRPAPRGPFLRGRMTGQPHTTDPTSVL